jgi:hypothetical protein
MDFYTPLRRRLRHRPHRPADCRRVAVPGRRHIQQGNTCHLHKRRCRQGSSKEEAGLHRDYRIDPPRSKHRHSNVPRRHSSFRLGSRLEWLPGNTAQTRYNKYFQQGSNELLRQRSEHRKPESQQWDRRRPQRPRQHAWVCWRPVRQPHRPAAALPPPADQLLPRVLSRGSKCQPRRANESSHDEVFGQREPGPADRRNYP